MSALSSYAWAPWSEPDATERRDDGDAYPAAAAPETPSNEAVADLLEQTGVRLRGQGASEARVQAWRQAAHAVRALGVPVSEGVHAGDAAQRLGIDPNVAAAIREIVRTGRLGYLARLHGELGEDALFGTIPGIGPTLARRLVRALDVHTLDELERAVHEGRLDGVPGIGPRRARRIAAALAPSVHATSQRRAHVAERPSVEMLLAIDDQYRDGERENRLVKIAPRRMNRARAAWLPIMHVDEQGWHVTALFSNTARAHTLGTTHDWVVIYAQKDGVEQQYTVVTETQGSLVGLRVVRGRERECQEHYERVQGGF